MRAATYLRVSGEEQVKHGYSLPDQDEVTYARAIELGATSVVKFSDEGISGHILDRPALNKLREAVKNNELDLVVILDPDRFSRKLSIQLLVTEEFEKAGIKLVFIDFEWQDTPEGRLFYSIRGAISEFEREKIRDRMGRGKRQKAKKGGIPIGFYNYGYLYEPEKGSPIIDEDEAKVVVDIFKWFIEEDIGMNGIARRLNDLCIPTKKGKGGWHRNVVRQILKNPVYIGQWRYTEFTILVPEIVKNEIWLTAQNKLKESRRLWAGKSKNKYLLSGIITCSDCGSTMTGVYTNWWGQRVRRYSCHKNSEGAKLRGCLPVKYISADILEKKVWEKVCVWLNNPDEIAKQAENNVKDNNLKKELSRIDKLICTVDKGREGILDVISAGLVDLDNKTRSKLNELKRKKDSLEKRKKEIEEILKTSVSRLYKIEDLKSIAKEYLSKLDELSFEEKQFLVRSVLTQVIVSGRGKKGVKDLGGVQLVLIGNF